MRSLTWEEVRRRRLSRNYLDRPAPRERLAAVVAECCGIQAQILSAAELAIGARVSGLTQRDLRADLWERRSLVKTYGPRGTLHILPSDELPLWMAAMRAGARWRDDRWVESYGLDPAQGSDLLAAAGAALDGRCLTREELADAVAGLAGEWARERLASTWADLVTPAAIMGQLCFGPSRGAKVTYVRPDQWLGSWKAHDPDAALAEVLRRYLRAYGPATSGDFARWFGLEPAEARDLLATHSAELVEVDVEGRRAWLPAEEIAGQHSTEDGALRLVPQYDCYVLGCHPRERILPEPARARIFSYRRGRFEGAVALPVLLIDGVIAGIWERRQRGRGIDLRVEAFVPLDTSRRRQLEAEATRVGAFLGLPVALMLGTLD